MLFSIFYNQPWPISLIIFLAYVVAILLTLSLHNFFQAFAAYRQGDMTAKAYGMLSLNPFRHVSALGMVILILFGFGWSKPVPINPIQFKQGRKGAIKVALSGIIGNLITSILFSFFFALTLLIASESSFAIFIQQFCYFMTIINFIFFVFHLLPIFPLDMFVVLSIILRPDNKFLTFMLRWGFVVLLILIFSGLFGLLVNVMEAHILHPLIQLWQLILG